MARAAIVIGVNKTTGLAELTGAAADAKRFADWLGQQGYDQLKLMTDAGGGKVRFSDVFDEVAKIVNEGRHSQLVIYFSGHGFQSVQSEIWLLSGAPQNPAEAIALEPSISASRESGLTSVVFVSDACRSIPNTMEFIRVTGASIFPSTPLNRNQRPDVDRFFATLPSLVAVEAAKADDKARRGGVFTREFMDVHRNPPAQSVAHAQENGQSVEVITTRALRPLVRQSVEEAVYEIAPTAGQLPDAIIESVDAYIGRVERPAATRGDVGLEYSAPQSPDPPKEVLSVAEVAREVIRASTRTSQPAAPWSQAAQDIYEAVGLPTTMDLYATAAATDHFESGTGFAITGATVDRAWATKASVAPLGNELVRIEKGGGPPDAPAGSTVIRFGGGNGTVLPWFRDYIGHVFVESGVVTNVNYEPSTNSWRWSDYFQVKQRLDALRAAVAAAARLGVFRIDRDEASEFADKIRILKGIDPTLGIYAAYAYASAGLQRDVESIAQYMRGDLAADLFDVAMLARRGVSSVAQGGSSVVPFCPVLRQGWALLAVRDAKVPAVVQQAQLWLQPALWTTFAPEGVDLLSHAIEQGVLS